MSLDKAIKYGKEHRNPYRTASHACRVHGGCKICLGDRMYRTMKEKQRTEYDMKTTKREHDLDQS
jgi:hypothetical protein